MQLAENTVVAGRFRLNRLIGKGGMGSVWLATHLGLDIPCAVKFIEGEMAAVPEMQMRFEREAKAAAQLRSPHVVQILDHGVCEGTPYIAMELLDGEDLGKRFAKVGRMAPAQLHNFIGQVCRALSRAHALGIVHRDLKPDNIFLVRDDDREIAKVLDFGIAKSKGSELSGSNTKTGAMLGTPYYMSPEQAQGTRALDFRSDLWSLAVITFQGLTGRLPFESEALGDLLMKIMVTELPQPSQYGCSLPAIDGWWRKAAARDPAQRFQSAKEFADSLALVCGVSQLSFVHEHPPVLMPGPTGTVALRSDGPSAAPFAAMPWQPPHVATIPDALPGAAGGGLTPSPMSRTFADGAPAAKTSALPFVAIGVVVFAAVLGVAFLALHVQSAPSAATSSATSGASAVATASAPPSAVAHPPATTTEPPSPRAPPSPAPSSPVPAAGLPAPPPAAADPEPPAVSTKNKTGADPTPTKPAGSAKAAARHGAPADLGF